MLVLNRRKGESVLIKITPEVAKTVASLGSDLIIEVTLAEIHLSNAKLGFTAPKTVLITRNELVEKKIPKQILDVKV